MDIDRQYGGLKPGKWWWCANAFDDYQFGFGETHEIAWQHFAAICSGKHMDHPTVAEFEAAEERSRFERKQLWMSTEASGFVETTPPRQSFFQWLGFIDGQRVTATWYYALCLGLIAWTSYVLLGFLLSPNAANP